MVNRLAQCFCGQVFNIVVSLMVMCLFFHSLFWAFVGFSAWKCIVWVVKCLLELFDTFFPPLPLFVCREISNWVLGLQDDTLIFFVQLLLICLFGDFFSFLLALLNLLLAFRKEGFTWCL